MKTFYARICWNETGWTKPDATAWPHDSKDTYLGENGFGHEEWLFNRRHQIGEYQYGFIEGFNQTQKLEKGEAAKIILYTLGPKVSNRRRPRYFVGTLLQCERLTDDIAEEAKQHFRNSGWLNSMVRDISTAITPLPLPKTTVINKFRSGSGRPTHLINLRYRWSETVHPGRLIPVPQNHPIQNRDYYHFLYEADESDDAFTRSNQRTRSHPTGTKQPLPIPKKKRRKRNSHKNQGDNQESQNLHIRMQNKLLEKWQSEFGDCVWLEDNYVDVVVRAPDRLIFCEVKAVSPASQVIREALGQILEYVHYDGSEGESYPEIHIAGLAELTNADKRYLNKLRTIYRLEITYHYVEL